MAGPTREFWQDKFDKQTTPWDRGAASPQLAAWLADGSLAAGRIAVPGCGSGYEVVELAGHGFSVTAIDYAQAAIARTRNALDAAGRQADVQMADVLAWNPQQPFDAVYEQTCLCALHPDHWVAYAAQLHAWIKPGGRLFALFMQGSRKGAAEGFVEGPPYHSDIHAMRALFDAGRWDWPKPPYARIAHPMGMAELAVILTRRA
ncbi:MAG: methyltransferase domain-containing protein [Burkholderiales bacterium]